MPTSVSSTERLWGALRDAYYDEATPGEVSPAEWEGKLKPALEAKRDLDDGAVNLLHTLADWSVTAPKVRDSIRHWLANESSKHLALRGPTVSLDNATAGRKAALGR